MFNSVHCPLDINECVVSSPCKNGGTCSNMPGSYKCTCDVKYSGKNCETGRSSEETWLIGKSAYLHVRAINMGYWSCLFGQDGWILARFIFLRVYGPRRSRERGQYPDILTEQAWSKKDLFYGFRVNFSCGTQRVVPSGQNSSILPKQVANHSAGFGSSSRLMGLVK